METVNNCLECKKDTEIMVDYKSGDTICGECGLVLEGWYIEETMEWRTFNDDSNDNRDPQRVGQPQNPFLTHPNLLVNISNNPKSSGLSNKKLHNDPDDVLIKGFGLISDMAARLGLVLTIQHRAADIYKHVEEHKSCRGRKLETVMAACLFIACRESKVSRTLKEFTMLPYQLKEKEIYKAVDLIKKQLEVKMGSVQAVEYVARFCSYLGMDRNVVRAVREAVERAEKLDLRRSPKSVLAAIIYMMAQLSPNKKSLRDVSIVAEVAETTIKKSYKDLHPYASTLIPNWFANQDRINKLQDP